MRPAFLSGVCMAAARAIWVLLHLGCHRSAVSLSTLNVSPLTQLPQCGVGTPASVPPPTKGRSSPTNTPVFLPSFFILLSFAWFYIFCPLVKYSCLLSADVLHALLCLEVCSWCVCEQRWTTHPPTPLPSCSLLTSFNIQRNSTKGRW